MITPVATNPIIVLVGLPFSGKSTLVESLRSPDTLVIERDRFLEELQNDEETKKKIAERAMMINHPVSTLHREKEKNAYNDALTLEYVERVAEKIKNYNGPVIVDGTHLQALSRSFITLFPEREKIAYVLKTPVETCVERLKKTVGIQGIRSTVTPELIRSLEKVFEVPTKLEGFDSIVIPTEA